MMEESRQRIHLDKELCTDEPGTLKLAHDARVPVPARFMTRKDLV